jgi:hypothetical protein
VRTSDEEFEQPGGPIRGEKGRGERGGCGVLIGVVLMAITCEKSTGGVTLATISRNGERGRRLWEEGMTCGVHLSASGGGDAGTLSGWRVAGPRAESGAGLNGLLRPFYPFL